MRGSVGGSPSGELGCVVELVGVEAVSAEGSAGVDQRGGGRDRRCSDRHDATLRDGENVLVTEQVRGSRALQWIVHQHRPANIAKKKKMRILALPYDHDGIKISLT